MSEETKTPDAPACPFCGGPNPFAGDGDQLVVGRVFSTDPDAPPAPPIDWTATTILAAGDREALGTRPAGSYSLPFEARPVCDWLAAVGDTGSYAVMFPAVAAALSAAVTRALKISDSMFGQRSTLPLHIQLAAALSRAMECVAFSTGAHSAITALSPGTPFELEEAAGGGPHPPEVWIQYAIAYLLEAHEHAMIAKLHARHSAAH